MGPEIKKTLSTILQEIKKMVKSNLANSDQWRTVSFVPTWTITLLMEEGSDGSKPWSFFVRGSGETECDGIKETHIPSYGIIDSVVSG